MPNRRGFLKGALALPSCTLLAGAEQPSAEKPLSPAPPGQWLQHRGDRALTARSPLKGTITSPRVKWKFFIGGRESLLHVRVGGEPSDIELPARDVKADQVDVLSTAWTAPPALDPDRDTPPAQRGATLGKFLRGQVGLQKIEFDPAGYCRLMAREKGQWFKVWQSERITDVMQGLNTLTGDFDNDGALEVAFTPWTNLYVLDLATGKLKAKARFYQDDALGDGRPYGCFIAADVDGDGKQEFIIVSDTQKYISVLGWRDGQLKLLWGKMYQTKSEARRTQRGCLLQPGANPVRDVDGDGRPEIVLSYFLEPEGDKGPPGVGGRWRTEVLDGRTGERKTEIADERLIGLCDVRGDGVAELFCVRTAKEAKRETGRLSVLGLRDGRLTERWQLADGSAFQVQPLRVPPDNVHNAAAGGLTTLLAGPDAPGLRPLFVTHKAAGERAELHELTFWRADDRGEVRKLGSVTGPQAEALAVKDARGAEGGLLVRLLVPRDGSCHLRSQGTTARLIGSRRIGLSPAPVVIGRLAPAERPTLVAQEAGERLVAFRVAAGGKAEVLWDAPGRGMHEGSDHRTGGCDFAGVNLADLRGDGRLAILAGTRGPQDQARLVARSADGREIWHRDFDPLPGAPPGFTLPGLSFWFAGRFTDRRREDVLAAVKSGVATRLVLLDGRTGEPRWSRPVGGMYMAVYDHDGDGLDDALTTCWSEVRVVKGNTGADLLHLNTSPPGLFGKVWPTDAPSCAAEVLGRGQRQIVYWPSYAARGLVGADGRLIWQHQEKEIFFGTPSVYPGIGDLDGDGKLELVCPGDHPGPRSQACRCFDAATGKVKWELTLEDVAGRIGSAVTADVDGDGRDECLFSVGQTLYAVGATRDGKAGEVRWKLGFPAALGPVALADVEGDGKLQIVLACADGHVYGVG